MIQLQVDAFSPFPDERMCVAHEVLAVSDSVTRVLIAAVQKDVIESTGVMLKEAGLDVQRIDAEIMAWWQMIAPQSSIPGEGRLLILVIEKDGGAWIVADKKGPLALRALIPSGGLLPAEYVKEISDDAGTFMLSIDLEHGSAPLAGVEVWHKGIDAAELLLSDALKNHFRHEVITHSLDTLRPLSEGMAQRFFGTDLADSLRRVKKGQPVLDLVPQSWRSAIIARRVRLRLLAATVGVLIAWFLAMGVFLGLYQYQKYRIAKLEKHLKLLEGPKREVMEMQNKVKSFEQYLDRQNSTLECLREISQPLPKDVILTSFNFKKGKSFVIRGEALQSSAVTDYKKELDKSPLFNTVEMGAIKTGKRKEASIQTFDMTIKLKEKQ
jgi:Tfp pilus assembly protein PilN